ncbi:MAG: Lrp/AsnC family transcriptional regulator [Clostridiales bacterium]|jgi:DNA-binding Lrp family transcriptional regulator|nr:Lrp/AsnC family transcriptional regulator [Clostridiales bacterium]
MTKLQTEILNALSEDSRLTAERLAGITGEKTVVVAQAIEGLERAGVIVKYNTVINTEKTDKETVEALIEVRVSPEHNRGFDSIAEELYLFSEVRSLYLMSGGYDLAVFVEGRTLKEVAMFVSEKLSTIDKVLSTATHFILKKYKFEGVLMEPGDERKRLAVHV